MEGKHDEACIAMLNNFYAFLTFCAFFIFFNCHFERKKTEKNLVFMEFFSQVEGKHDEACIAMLNNFYADGAVSFFLLRIIIIIIIFIIVNVIIITIMYFVKYNNNKVMFVIVRSKILTEWRVSKSLHIKILLISLEQYKSRRLLFEVLISGVARHCLLPQQLVCVRGRGQVDELRQADQPRACTQDLENARPPPIYVPI